MDLSNENVIHIKDKDMEYLQFRKLLEYPEIKHLYTLGLKKDYRTVRANKEPLEDHEYKQAVQNYNKLCEKINESHIEIIQAGQTHSDHVKAIYKKEKQDQEKIERSEDTDALITDQKDIILATTNADCILLLIFDPIQKVVANVHSGWRGTLQRISVKTIEKMKKEYNSNPEDIICCICPSIRKCHFKVDREVKDMFENEFKDIDTHDIIEETKKDEKWNIDTVEINKIILQRQGLRKENIIDSKLCSVCNKDIIHSFRVEKEGYGVEVAMIKIN